MTPVTVYFKAEQKIEPSGELICIGDFGKLSCTDKAIEAAIKKLPVVHCSEIKVPAISVSIMKLIQIITTAYPLTEVVSVGESDIIISMIPEKQHAGIWVRLKIIFVCMISFFGTAFTIMAFHNDIGIAGVFERFYTQLTRKPYPGFGILEIAYSFGLSGGIILFFNHLPGRRITHDPTPVEVEMRLYETDVNTTLTKALSREGETIDVE